MDIERNLNTLQYLVDFRENKSKSSNISYMLYNDVSMQKRVKLNCLISYSKSVKISLAFS